jgi:hypothetical protein
MRRFACGGGSTATDGLDMDSDSQLAHSALQNFMAGIRMRGTSHCGPALPGDTFFLIEVVGMAAKVNKR